ncbi:MAG: hypothetical protein RLZZ352_2344 [Pseudomonadota bacterium]|jgi:hypothetical protein
MRLLRSGVSSSFVAASHAVLVSACVLSVALWSPLAQAVPDAQFEPAQAVFLKAAEGDKSAVDRAADAFAALLKADPTNPVLLAYSGSATSMKATTTWLPWKMMRHAEDGLAQIDKALALLTPAHNAPLQRGTPAVLEVKLVAANTFMAVPGFMNRKERGERLLKDVLTSPLLAGAPAEFQASVQKAAKAHPVADKP